MFLLRQHNEFFRLMIKQGVDFLIIGGYAVNFHGYSRMTEYIQLPFISFNHLILSKISNNRLRDQADVEELQKISRIKSKPGQ